MLIVLPLIALGMGLDEFFKSTPKGMTNTFFSAASFIPYFGYIYKRKMLSKDLWRPFVVGFFLWELICYFTYGNSPTDNIIVFISILPKYFSVAMYGLYMGSFRLPENKSFEEIENSFFQKVLFKLVVSASILINIFFGLIGIFAILNPEISQA